jgi:guanylate kinase
MITSKDDGTQVQKTEPKLLLIMGPSGVGKTTVIQRLCRTDNRFVYVAPYTTRKIRKRENDKMHIGIIDLRRLDERGDLIAINEMYGAYYGTPKQPIFSAFANALFPVLDWPIEQAPLMQKLFKYCIFSVYIEPTSLEVLIAHLRNGRDPTGERLRFAVSELEALHCGQYRDYIDLRTISIQGEPNRTVNIIHENYLKAIGKHSPIAPITNNENTKITE